MIVHGLTASGVPKPIKVAADGSVFLDGTITAIVDETTLAKEATLASVLANQTNGNQQIKTKTPVTSTPDVVRGTIGGGALPSLDAAPVGAAQANAARFIPTRGGEIYGAVRITLLAVNGTSLTVQPWWYDDTLGVWTKISTTTVVNTATQGTALTLAIPPGMLVFMQNTANTGVEKFMWWFN
jgi:hypothetical protein